MELSLKVSHAYSALCFLVDFLGAESPFYALNLVT